MITIIGLGSGEDTITLGALKAMHQADRLYIRTSKHSVASALKKLGFIFKTFDDEYESQKDFDSLYDKIAQTLLSEQG
ncbi:MAG TPA: nucleotide pyrophosphohydrolase, partial [Clostridia bacterium]|nr:nucleotide pyrophosphohydrolase [Clostridia bacterium]